MWKTVRQGKRGVRWLASATKIVLGIHELNPSVPTPLVVVAVVIVSGKIKAPCQRSFTRSAQHSKIRARMCTWLYEYIYMHVRIYTHFKTTMQTYSRP